MRTRLMTLNSWPLWGMCLAFAVTLEVVAGPQVSIIPRNGPSSKVSVPATDFQVSRVLDITLSGTIHAQKPVYLTGTGVMRKPILFLFPVTAYIASHYLSDSKAAIPSEWESTFRLSDLRVLSLRFLRDISLDKMRDGFQDALRVNHLNPKSDRYRKVFSSFTENFSQGDILYLVGYCPRPQESKGSANSEDHVYFVLRHGKKVTLVEDTGVGLASDYWKIWFGVPAHEGLKNLKSLLLSLLPQTVE